MSSSVLVVDDQATVRHLLRLILELNDYEVSEAVDGIDALEKIKLSRPDVVILDTTMPRLDGLSVCRELRDSPETAELPVIILSGREEIGAMEEAMQAGATTYLTKPLSSEELLENLNRVR